MDILKVLSCKWAHIQETGDTKIVCSPSLFFCHTINYLAHKQLARSVDGDGGIGRKKVRRTISVEQRGRACALVSTPSPRRAVSFCGGVECFLASVVKSWSFRSNKFCLRADVLTLFWHHGLRGVYQFWWKFKWV